MRELSTERSVKGRVPVSMDVDPQRRYAIEVCASFGIDQVRPFAPFDDQRRLSFPFLHLREGVPQELLVPVGEAVTVGASCHGGKSNRKADYKGPVLL